jgi:DNA-binding MarR family transcriptional regulator
MVVADVGSGGSGHPAPADRDHGWLDEDERSTWLSLLRVMTRLPPLLDSQLERASGLNLFEYTILAMLSEEPDGTLRMSRLASVTNASPSKLSHAARHLEARGLLVRLPDPDDGRCIRALLTGAGHEQVVQAAPGHVAAVRDLVLDVLDPDQLRALREANEQILLRVDPEGATDPGSPPKSQPPPDRADRPARSPRRPTSTRKEPDDHRRP